MDSKYYILDGKIPRPVDDILEWARCFESSDRIVKKDTVLGCDVSTVFLGTNHAFFGGPPLLFETMIFGGEHDEYQERYSTWEEAEAGHQRAIELVFQ